ncbi:uncharacterized protein KY384_001573 [Bacidia gigantensis]|uniref:uncharacterized protein n=1 Tax=Bacidia gigantensis TaxID=2732470 RepID=UPI001D04CF73|nr:uncharacterized protein KY384_001573 [Bacidia gigantensis]KAG8533832.1 hypothetical protein KY384_001573 [Bacidia gigantensis]
MARQRRASNVSNNSSTLERDDQVLSAASRGRVLSSQTIGVEFSSKIVKVGTGARRKRIKLQLWDTAGTERFRSVSRSYYRGAAGAVLVYDLASHTSFDALPTFLSDARALASPNLTVLLAGNKVDLTANITQNGDAFHTLPTSASLSSNAAEDDRLGSSHSSIRYGLGSQQTRTVASEGREVPLGEASRWASESSIPVAVEVSAFTGDGVDDVFSRLASIILTKIELGEIDPDDPMSGIQYGDSMSWDDGGSVKSRGTVAEDGGSVKRRRKGGGKGPSWGSDWTFQQADDPDFHPLPTQGFPTEVFLDLHHHNLIPSPFLGKNEDQVQWVGEKSWLYATRFLSPPLIENENAVLVFKGLDTYATVKLNGTRILESSNMFVPERVDVTNMLSSGGEGRLNELEIVFENAWLKGKKVVGEHPEHAWGCWNGDVYEMRISDLYFKSVVSESLDVAEVVAMADIEGKGGVVTFEISLDQDVVGKESVKVVDGHAEAAFTTRKPHLWYPRRYGQQPLYTLKASLCAYGSVQDTESQRFGLRRARIKQQGLEDAKGTTFTFEINNMAVFCGGSNWIPTDSFLTRINTDRYRDWVKMMADGNQAMLRVWGGGVYEHDAFYSACDEMGILVWQDFMFACGNYPVYPEYIDTVKREAVANVKRLRHHPSIIMWSGNNEDYQYAESEGLAYDQKETDPDAWLKSDFPARYIYEKILPKIVSKLTPNTHYHPGSPWGGQSSTDPTVGDIHQWNVWHGSQAKYQDFDKLSGRFVSEFGMQALPNMRTVKEFFNKNDQRDRYAESSTVSFHNKAAGHDRRLGIYLTENIRYRFRPLDRYVYCTQVMQADCIASAFRLWKRQWKGPGREYCSGALVWQTNDCWPCTSWSIADYHLRPKLAYYAIKREMEPITVGMKRVITEAPADKYTEAFVKKTYSIEMWVCNFDIQAHRVGIKIHTSNLDTGVCGYHRLLSQNVVLPPNQTTEVFRFDIPVKHKDTGEELQTVVGAELIYARQTQPQVDLKSKVFLNWPEPLKYAHLPDGTMRITLHSDIESNDSCKDDTAARNPNQGDIKILKLDSSVPLKCVSVEFESIDNRAGAVLNDNGFDMWPGCAKYVSLGVSENTRLVKPRIRHLGSKRDCVTELNISTAGPLQRGDFKQEGESIVLGANALTPDSTIYQHICR